MAMTLRLTEDEQAALRERAEAEGISMQEAARRAVRDYVARSAHRERVSDAARRVIDAHADVLYFFDIGLTGSYVWSYRR